MNCVVTGCAGFIGSHLAESLLEDGFNFVGVDCFHANYRLVQKRVPDARLHVRQRCRSCDPRGGLHAGPRRRGAECRRWLTDFGQASVGAHQRGRWPIVGLALRTPPSRGVAHTDADTSKARTKLGFAPTVGFEEGLRAEFSWIAATVGTQPQRPAHATSHAGEGTPPA